MKNKFDKFDIFTLKLFYCNARSLKNKVNSLQYLLGSNQYDILAFVETWVGSNIDDVTLVGSENSRYIVFRNDRKFTGKGGGAALFIDRKYNPLLIETIEIMKICINLYSA